ncbi:very short patch repair endonuclease [Mangrovibacter sp. MFB070]|uniref:very short patch repair endonuclease n=1 Tax=Mangrovibacter sp. MFB070 TaxID=1224318 RepID=UPI0004D96ACF|nr:DNA mismatch endonuclease Vsr [Mangrovibacter sp. MFB070]KEA54610.1 very short patch repair endonuclease [Mangrovibacter sp. MFB070]
MADVHSKAVRRKNMQAIHTSDTAIEQRLAGLLDSLGFDYRVQDKTLPGCPDFVVDAQQCVVFTHGCFWHRHDCHLFKVPATRTEFWLEKLGNNAQRDVRDTQQLIASGWRVLWVWECALRGKEKLTDEQLSTRLEEWIFSGGILAEIDSQGIHDRSDSGPA